MFTPHVIFLLAVDFVTDFLTGLATGLGGSVAGSAAATDVIQIPGLPAKYVWVVGVIGGLLAGLRGLKKNLSAPITAVPSLHSFASPEPPAERA